MGGRHGAPPTPVPPLAAKVHPTAVVGRGKKNQRTGRLWLAVVVRGAKAWMRLRLVFDPPPPHPAEVPLWAATGGTARPGPRCGVGGARGWPRRGTAPGQKAPLRGDRPTPGLGDLGGPTRWGGGRPARRQASCPPRPAASVAEEGEPLWQTPWAVRTLAQGGQSAAATTGRGDRGGCHRRRRPLVGPTPPPAPPSSSESSAMRAAWTRAHLGGCAGDYDGV